MQHDKNVIAADVGPQSWHARNVEECVQAAASTAKLAELLNGACCPQQLGHSLSLAVVDLDGDLQVVGQGSAQAQGQR